MSTTRQADILNVLRRLALSQAAALAWDGILAADKPALLATTEWALAQKIVS